MSGIPGSNRRLDLGKVTYCHYTTPACKVYHPSVQAPCLPAGLTTVLHPQRSHNFPLRPPLLETPAYRQAGTVSNASFTHCFPI